MLKQVVSILDTFPLAENNWYNVHASGALPTDGDLAAHPTMQAKSLYFAPNRFKRSWLAKGVTTAGATAGVKFRDLPAEISRR